MNKIKNFTLPAQASSKDSLMWAGAGYLVKGNQFPSSRVTLKNLKAHNGEYGIMYPGISQLVNPVGAKVYVDFDAPTSGDGLSWTTAFNSLQAVLDSARIFVTARTMRQVVHVYTRGSVQHKGLECNFGFGDTTYNPYGYGGYLVIHDVKFDFNRADSEQYVIYPKDYRPCLIHAVGIVFINCEFTVTFPDGADATTSGEDGEDAPSWVGLYSEIITGSRNYLYKCKVTLNGGSGGSGAKGKDATSTSAGGGYTTATNGGNAGSSLLPRFHVEVMAYCDVEIIANMRGNGGAGGNGVATYHHNLHAADGGAGSQPFNVSFQYPCRIAYHCNFKYTANVTGNGGDGGSGAVYLGDLLDGNDNPTGAQYAREARGGIGGYPAHPGTNTIMFAYLCMVGCVVDVNINSTCSAGSGGAIPEHSYLYEYYYDDQDQKKFLRRTVYAIPSRGSNDGVMQTAVNLSDAIDSVVNVKETISGRRAATASYIPTVSGSNLHNVQVNINTIHGYTLIQPWIGGKSAYELPALGARWGASQTIDTTTYNVNVGAPPSFPSGEITGTEEHLHDGRKYTLIFRSIPMYLIYREHLINCNPNTTFPTKWGKGAPYGVIINITAPQTVTAGANGGGYGSFEGRTYTGWIVNGTDAPPGGDITSGATSTERDVHDGGHASAAWTLYGYSAPAGSPGAGGVEADGTPGRDGVLVAPTEAPYPKPSFVTINFV